MARYFQGRVSANINSDALRAIREILTPEQLALHIGRARNLNCSVVVASIEDESTGTSVTVHRIALAAELAGPFEVRPLSDCEALLRLNEMAPDEQGNAPLDSDDRKSIASIVDALPGILAQRSLSFRRPKVTPSPALLPSGRAGSD